MAGYDSSLLSDALIRSRDGISGIWQDPGTPDPLKIEDPANLERWAAWVRASVFDFEIFSRVGFSSETSTTGEITGPVSIWHLQTTPAAPGGTSVVAPTVQYQPLLRFVRPSVKTFRAQVALTNNYADLRPDRTSEVISQLGGGQAFLASVAYLSPDRTPWTLELLAAAFRLANFVEMRIKHALACRRPIEYSPQIQPMILTPAHGALPSGHATETFMMALVLWNLIRSSGSAVYSTPIWGVQLMQLAARVAINRQVAGVHTPMESAAGAMLGLTLGQYLVDRCEGTATTYQAWMFSGDKYPDDEDFDWTELYDVGTPGQSATAYVEELTVPDPAIGAPSSILEWLWTKAAAEWP